MVSGTAAMVFYIVFVDGTVLCPGKSSVKHWTVQTMMNFSEMYLTLS